MSWTEHHTNWFAKKLLKGLESQKGIHFLKNPKSIQQEIVQILSRDLEKEQALEKEVTQILDELEQTQGASFNRGKMRPMLKKKLAEKKGVIL